MSASLVCIECGSHAENLYKEYKGGIVKISHCKKCGNPTDKYIEYDPVIILLDLFLHKTQAYRHIIYNTDTSSSSWRLCILCLLCDAYMKWASLKERNGHVKDFLYYALSWDYYAMFFLAILELGVFIGSILAALYLLEKLFPTEETHFFWNSFKSIKMLVDAMLLCNAGKLFIIPAVIWGDSGSSSLCLWLARAFTFTSSTKALKVLIGRNLMILAGMVLTGHCVQTLVQVALSNSLEK